MPLDEQEEQRARQAAAAGIHALAAVVLLREMCEVPHLGHLPLPSETVDKLGTVPFDGAQDGLAPAFLPPRGARRRIGQSAGRLVLSH